MSESTSRHTYALIFKNDASGYTWLHVATDAEADVAVEELIKWFAAFGAAKRQFPGLSACFIYDNPGGGGGIRTPGTLARSTVFKTAAFNHSATPPQQDASFSTVRTRMQVLS